MRTGNHNSLAKGIPRVKAFARWYQNAVDGVAPIANKLGAFLANPIMRQVVCEPKEPLRFRRIMDEGEILIVNLAKGRLGTDSANVLGGLVVTNLINAAFTAMTYQRQNAVISYFILTSFIPSRLRHWPE
jgi:hypothetical protein